MTEDSASINITVRGPGGLKLQIDIETEATVAQLKQKIADTDKDYPVESGKVLKDDQTIESYGIKTGNMVHMVRSSRPASERPAATPAATQSSGTSESQGVPSNFAAGQHFSNNPLSALNRADYAGPHMASLLNEAGGMFGEFGGMNPRDPNVMLGMMQNPEFLRHMRDMLGRPEVVDQIIASNPQMQAMGPQVREMLRSEHFRDMITNPETMQRMTQLSQALGGLGGANGNAPGWPLGGPLGQSTDTANANGTSGAAGEDPLRALSNLQQLLGGGAGLGGLSGLGGLGALGGLGGLGTTNAANNGDSRPPEERYAAQLEQLHNMGFYDAQANLRALLLSGGSVEGAVGILLD
ncbi:hypothetical protein MCUN1_001087 [Malassezia cuniculi]|uniref:Ubiquitin domain-containing protein DSK2 n=1 Tax=Malassezia cuniculi TaxID=948313 RepID=A0AAF0ES79_9BASI|nr:hypothetical protein MCUN1_001087 [Malassezia cuniculi]